jgi:UDP-N-acetylglucosamine--N-acetylmuramyl-(pentapeptide) pyrophosphoryl-undecaprenol N-acetylglucosamine transferase
MKILIASGGSGGHIFPAVAVARKLHNEQHDVIFVASSRNLDQYILRNEPYRKIFIPPNPMPHDASLAVFGFVFKMFVECFRTLWILVHTWPRAVIGFGGYTAGALCILARLLGRTTIIHEQNVVPGRANRLLDRFVSGVAVSFPETEKYFSNRHVVYTGNPIREESLADVRTDALRRYGLDERRFTILVMGGSQGAHSLNHIVSLSLGYLPEEKKKNVQVVHITGQKDLQRCTNYYRKSGIEGRVFTFVDKINEAYSVCDLAISRAGAAAISELAAFGKPMILIPYPSPKNNQRYNAAYFSEKKAALYRDESHLTKEALRDLIAHLIDDPGSRCALAENVRTMAVVDGAQRLKAMVLSAIPAREEEGE